MLFVAKNGVAALAVALPLLAFLALHTLMRALVSSEDAPEQPWLFAVLYLTRTRFS